MEKICSICSMGVLFRGFEDGCIICDITTGKPYTKKIDGEIKRFPAPRIYGAKLKLENDVKLLEKVKSLRKRTSIWITYKTDMPLRYVTEYATVLKVLTKKEYDTIAEPYRKREKEMMKQNMKVLKKCYG